MTKNDFFGFLFDFEHTVLIFGFSSLFKNAKTRIFKKALKNKYEGNLAKNGPKDVPK